MAWPATMVVFAVLTLPGLSTAKEPKNKLPRYTVQDLGTLGGTFSFAGGINHRGDVEGYSTSPGDLGFSRCSLA